MDCEITKRKRQSRVQYCQTIPAQNIPIAWGGEGRSTRLYIEATRQVYITKLSATVDEIRSEKSSSQPSKDL